MRRPLASRLAATSALGLLCAALACGGGDDDDGPALSSGSTCPDGSSLTYETFGKTFADTYCVGCHSSEKVGAARNGAPVSYDFDTVEGIRDLIAAVDHEAAAGPAATNADMPPIGITPMPSADQRADLGEWLACGAP